MTKWLVVLAIGCKGAGADGDVASDGGGDADTDADSDSDTDADSDADSDPVRLFDADHVLVVPDGNGLTLMRSDGAVAFAHTWTELMGPCDLCGGEGSSADGDGLLLAFTTNGPVSGGAIARLDASGGLDFRVDGFTFPHDAVRDPADGSIIIPEATANRMTWIPGDGTSDVAVHTLSTADPDWPGDTPNGIDRFDYHGGSYLVSSHRGAGGGFGGSGEITMWDITDPSAPALMWTYPSTGSLNTPHGAMYRQYGGRWWLLYAHSAGTASGSTVGLAVTDDPTVAPDYVADLVPVQPVGAFGFLRGVELTSDGWLWLTDSGGQGGFGGPETSGRVVKAPMPSLSPTGATGASGSGQVFEDLTGGEVVLDGLKNPFEGWLWLPTFPL